MQNHASPPFSIQLTSQNPQDPDGKLGPATEADPLLGPRTDIGGAVSGTQASQTSATAPIAHHVSRQIAEALQHMPNRPVEITLSPKELGRVRLAVSSTEGGIVVNVLAERPETIDLMRRHISHLETAFQDIGYSDIAFSFSGGEQAQKDGRSDGSGADKSQILADQSDLLPATTEITLTTDPTAGVDLRL